MTPLLASTVLCGGIVGDLTVMCVCGIYYCMSHVVDWNDVLLTLWALVTSYWWPLCVDDDIIDPHTLIDTTHLLCDSEVVLLLWLSPVVSVVLVLIVTMTSDLLLWRSYVCKPVLCGIIIIVCDIVCTNSWQWKWQTIILCVCVWHCDCVCGIVCAQCLVYVSYCVPMWNPNAGCHFALCASLASSYCNGQTQWHVTSSVLMAQPAWPNGQKTHVCVLCDWLNDQCVLLNYLLLCVDDW